METNDNTSAPNDGGTSDINVMSESEPSCVRIKMYCVTLIREKGSDHENVALLNMISDTFSGAGVRGGPAKSSCPGVLVSLRGSVFAAVQRNLDSLVVLLLLLAVKERVLVVMLFSEEEMLDDDWEMVKVKVVFGSTTMPSPSCHEITGAGKPSAEHDRLTLSPATATVRLAGCSTTAGNTGEE